jgi:hypothetical protein
MPYIAREERPALDRRVAALAEEIAVELVKKNGDTDVSYEYRSAFKRIAKTLRDLESGAKPKRMGAPERLAVEIFEGAKKHKQRGAWLGNLNYSITRVIQAVPAVMVRRRAWKEEFRYWLYAQTVGALERSAMDCHAGGTDDWFYDGLVGVLVDVKDEYKRRVNAAYEAVQIMKSGDCYDTPYRTEVFEVRGKGGVLEGYQETMKDYRGAVKGPE